ncbi:MAG: hypothetical protein PWP51_677 [Clostridiales bacterium]|nr:hypothetical protein [Clostridiales bacterium]
MNNPGFIEAFIDYVSKNYMRILTATGEHIYISLIALAITLVTCTRWVFT